MNDKMLDTHDKKFIGNPDDDFWKKQHIELLQKSGVDICKVDNQCRILGSGGFGIVFIGKREQKQFAVKMIKLRDAEENYNQEKMNKLICMAKNEMLMANNFKHNHFIACYGYGCYELEFSRALVSIFNNHVHLDSRNSVS